MPELDDSDDGPARGGVDGVERIDGAASDDGGKDEDADGAPFPRR